MPQLILQHAGSHATFATKIAKKGAVLTMEHAGCKASLMRAPRLVGEGVHGLPSGQPVPVFPLSALPGAPDTWVRDGGSYVCPVSPNWGLWFSWCDNDQFNTAILPSVKGMNPITGQRIESLALEKYEKRCPLHDVEFENARFCPKCNYKWPPQNYVSYPNTLWWDGFRQSDGSVRQFFFTEDEIRDVASAVIGKENTVPAFGFAFYRTKTPRVVAQNVTRGYGGKYAPGVYAVCGPYGSQGAQGSVGHYAKKMSAKSKGICGQSLQSATVPMMYSDTSDNVSHDGSQVMCFMAASPEFEPSREVKTSGGVIAEDSVLGALRCATPPEEEMVEFMADVTDIKSVSVGAGAQINQDLDIDPFKLDQWQDKEQGIIRLYFVFEAEFKHIISNGGVRDLNGDAAGYLKGLPVG